MQVAPSDKRGTLGSVNQLVICFGILGALVVNVILPATDWRTMFYLAAIPPTLVVLGQASPPTAFCTPDCELAGQNAQAAFLLTSGNLFELNISEDPS